MTGMKFFESKICRKPNKRKKKNENEKSWRKTPESNAKNRSGKLARMRKSRRLKRPKSCGKRKRNEKSVVSASKQLCHERERAATPETTLQIR